MKYHEGWDIFILGTRKHVREGEKCGIRWLSSVKPKVVCDEMM